MRQPWQQRRTPGEQAAPCARPPAADAAVVGSRVVVVVLPCPPGHSAEGRWCPFVVVGPPPTRARTTPGCHRVLEDHEWQLAERQQRYGTNEMRIPVKGVAALVADEMWHPFYVFQYFSVVIWVAGDQYYIYAVCIFLITAFSIITSSVETHQNMKRLAELAHYTCTVGAQRSVHASRPGQPARLSVHTWAAYACACTPAGRHLVCVRAATAVLSMRRSPC